MNLLGRKEVDLKKGLLILGIILAGLHVMADEVIDRSGNTFECKLETVTGGIVEYTRQGNLYSFARTADKALFNDYVDVRTTLWHPTHTERVFGHITYRDHYALMMKTKDGDITIPCYRNHFVGIYKPD